MGDSISDLSSSELLIQTKIRFTIYLIVSQRKSPDFLQERQMGPGAGGLWGWRLLEQVRTSHLVRST